MLSTLLVAHAALVPVLALLLLGALVALGTVLQRGERTRTAGGLALAAVVAALVLTLTHDGEPTAAFCRVGFAWPTATGVEAFANLLLLLPPAFLGTIATRRPLAVAAAGTGLSAAIELAQGLLPALGRSCDTQDWEMNSIGVLAGALLGWWAGRLARPGGGRGRWAVTVVAGAALVAWLLAPAVLPAARATDPCDGPPAGAATRLRGDLLVTAGPDGGLCIASPTGTASVAGEVVPGPQSSDGRWEVGVEVAGTRSATDSAGRPVELHSVAGSDLLVWSAPAA